MSPAPASEKGFEDLDFFDAPCDGVIVALERERPEVETTTRFSFAPGAATVVRDRDRRARRRHPIAMSGGARR
jgi:hypothetical protein